MFKAELGKDIINNGTAIRADKSVTSTVDGAIKGNKRNICHVGEEVTVDSRLVL